MLLKYLIILGHMVNHSLNTDGSNTVSGLSALSFLLAFHLNIKSYPFFKTKFKGLLFNSVLYLAYLF